MPNKDLHYNLTATDAGASRTIKGVATAGQQSGKLLSSAFSQAGSIIGGEFGMILDKLSTQLSQVGDMGGKNLAKKFAIGGAGVAGLGGALTMMGSARMASTNQLKAAIEASGHSFDDYSKQIEGAVKAGEHFGHGENDTQTALRNLTAATQDPAKALADMTIVENLAAAQHTSLADAALKVAKVYGGAGRVLKEYGITMVSAKADLTAFHAATKNHETAVVNLTKANQKLMDLEAVDRTKKKLTIQDEMALRNAHDAVAKAQDNVRLTTNKLAIATANNKTQTQTADDALHKLGTRLTGQASAAADTWGGRIAALRAKLGDFAATIGQKYGPAITATGTVMLAAGTIMGAYGDHQDRLIKKAADLAKAQETSAARTVAAREAEAAKIAATDAEIEAADRGVIGPGGRSGARAGAGAAAGGGLGAAESAAPGGLKMLIGTTAAIIGLGVAINKLDGDNARWADFNSRNGNLLAGTKKDVDKLTQSLHANKDVMGEQTAAMIAQQFQSNGVSDNALKAGVSLGELTTGVSGTDVGFQNLIATLQASGAMTSQNMNQVLQMRSAYEQAQAGAKGLTQKQTDLNNAVAGFKSPAPIDIGAVDNASGVISKARTELETLNGQRATVYIAAVTESQGVYSAKGMSGVTVRFNAGGTDYSPGGMTTVGERGPEQVMLPRGAQVQPYTTGGGRSGGGDTYNVTFYVQGGLAGTLDPVTRSAIVGAVEQHVGAGGKIRIKQGVN